MIQEATFIATFLEKNIGSPVLLVFILVTSLFFLLLILKALLFLIIKYLIDKYQAANDKNFQSLDARITELKKENEDCKQNNQKLTQAIIEIAKYTPVDLAKKGLL